MASLIHKDETKRLRDLKCKVLLVKLSRKFYQLCLDVKNTHFPKGHLSKYASI